MMRAPIIFLLYSSAFAGIPVTYATDVTTTEPEVKKLPSLIDLEIASIGDLKIKGKFSKSALNHCIPRESIPLPAELPPELSQKIFDEDETNALMKCSTKNCKFNFAPSELKVLETEKTPQARKQSYYEFFLDHAKGKIPMNPNARWIRSSEKAFQICQSPELDKLLDSRPLAKVPYRLSHVRYSTQMRPTTRLVQGIHYQSGDAECYAEALIFSDHYDVDRVEIWSVAPKEGSTELQLEIRHRIDLLRHWLARHNPGFMSELTKLIDRQLTEAADCLKTQPPEPAVEKKTIKPSSKKPTSDKNLK